MAKHRKQQPKYYVSPFKQKMKKVGVILVAPALIAVIAAPLAAIATTHSEPVPKTEKVVSQVTQNVEVSKTATIDVVQRDSYIIIDPPPRTYIETYTNFANTFTNKTPSAVQWPFKVGVPFGDGFGHREAPCEVCSTEHSGQDFSPGAGSQIQAIADGTVIQVVNNPETSLENKTGSYGTFVVIQHNIDGQVVTSLYAHMEYLLSPMSVGQTIRVGDHVGNVGSTGQSTGAHLHLEIRINGKATNPVPWLIAHNV